MKKCDVTIVGYAVNQKSGGYGGNEYTFLKTIGAKYLYHNCFLDTYCAEPMAFMQLAAQLEAKNISVEVIDGLILGYDKKTVIDNLYDIESQIFCFSIYESTKSDIYEIVRQLKDVRKDVKIILGGPYATIAADEIINENTDVDYIVVGDADFALPELVDRLKHDGDISSVPNLYYRSKGDVIITKAECVDINTLEPPKRLYSDIIMREGYSFSISSSRGCGYANCSFCYLKKYQEIGNQPKHRYKNPEIVLDEIKNLIRDFNIEKLSFCDEDFFGNREGVKRAIKLFKLLSKENIKIQLHVNARVKTVIWLAKNNYLELCSKAGVKYMYVGLESYNDVALARYDKGINTSDIDYVINELDKYNILINPGLITFDPFLTIEEVKNNIELFKRIGYYDAFMFTRRLVYYPNVSSKIQMPQNQNEYFVSSNTKRLYESMCRYRDLVFPLYVLLDKERIDKALIDKLIDLHYLCFYEVYKNINNGVADVNFCIDEIYRKVVVLINDALEKEV